MVKRANEGTWLEQIVREKSTLTCATSWAAMAGDEQQRFCDRCQKNVVNLSSLTAREAEARLWREYRDSGEVPCVTIVVDEHDRMVSKPEARAALRSAAPTRLLALGLAASLPLAGCGRRATTLTGAPLPAASSSSTSQDAGSVMLTGAPPLPADAGPTGTDSAPDAACSASVHAVNAPTVTPPPPVSAGPRRLAGAPLRPPPQPNGPGKNGY